MIVVANWKMHKTVGQAVEWIRDLVPRLPPGVQVVVLPPYTAIAATVAARGEAPLAVGAQNLCPMPDGAYTGEVSAGMLKDLGCTHVLVGHSERRTLFGETDATVAAKVRAADAAGLLPILCVGEGEERAPGKADPSFVAAQVRAALKGRNERVEGPLWIAYEPLWAIGTGHPAPAGVARRAGSAIRRVLEDLLGLEAARRTSILYGGSVNPGNVQTYTGEAGLDGVLVGTASLDVAVFEALLAAGVQRGAPM